MAFFLISYDLHKVRVYEPLYKKLAEWKSVRLLESVWLSNINGTAVQVRDILTTLVDSDDSIAVIELKSGSDWATLRTKPGGKEWLQANIHP